MVPVAGVENKLGVAEVAGVPKRLGFVVVPPNKFADCWGAPKPPNVEVAEAAVAPNVDPKSLTYER